MVLRRIVTDMDPSSDTDRLFAALRIPGAATEKIGTTVKRFAGSVGHHIPKSRWHLTLAFLGETPLAAELITALPKTLSLPFFPTVSITHVGEGKRIGQLWAYAQPTTVLEDLRAATYKALQTPLPKEHDFIPHITIASIHKPKGRFGIQDVACAITFPAKEVIIFSSDTSGEHPVYTERASITITA